MNYQEMTFEQAVAYIDETPKFTKKNTLENTRAILRHLGEPQEKMKILHSIPPDSCSQVRICGKE